MNIPQVLFKATAQPTKKTVIASKNSVLPLQKEIFEPRLTWPQAVALKSNALTSLSFTSNNTIDKCVHEIEDGIQFRQEQRYGYDMRFHSTAAYSDALELKNFDVKRFINLGCESAVFELNDGNILKLSCEKYPPYIKEYHAPEIERGTIKLQKKHTAMNKSYNTFNTDEVYYVIQKRGEVATEDSKQEAFEMFRKAERDGYSAGDFDVDQFAYFDTPNGKKLKCIDLGCITDKDYLIRRDLEAVDKMSPDDACQKYGFFYFTLERYFKGILEKDGTSINDFLKSVKPRLESGESIIDIMNEVSKQ